MKNHFIRAAIFVAIGGALLSFGILEKDPDKEKLSGFAMGFSFPMFAGGLISVLRYFRTKEHAN